MRLVSLNIWSNNIWLCWQIISQDTCAITITHAPSITHWSSFFFLLAQISVFFYLSEYKSKIYTDNLFILFVLTVFSTTLWTYGEVSDKMVKCRGVEFEEEADDGTWQDQITSHKIFCVLPQCTITNKQIHVDEVKMSRVHVIEI